MAANSHAVVISTEATKSDFGLWEEAGLELQAKKAADMQHKATTFDSLNVCSASVETTLKYRVINPIRPSVAPRRRLCGQIS